MSDSTVAGETEAMGTQDGQVVEEAFAFPAALAQEFTELLTHYPQKQAALIPMLHRCQEDLGGWLRPEHLWACAEFLDMAPVEVFGVASFYPMFHLQPVGKHVVGVCHNVVCHIRGAEELLARAVKVTGAEVGGVSKDGKWSIVRLECQGACTAAPMIDLDGEFHENLSADDVERILGGVK
ncbi:MAG: NADH-quinone oxidoreductase subunit E [Planctomycetota bacterium]|jgi:NADH-quinone oxidoreductase subunit E